MFGPVGRIDIGILYRVPGMDHLPVADIVLVVLSTLAASSQFEGTALLGSLMKLVSFLVFWSVLGIYLLPTLINRIKRFVSDEILLVVSLGLCLLMVMIAVRAGFSSALGAFVMG